MNLVVGSDGLLGMALLRLLPEAKGSSRRPTALQLGKIWFDLNFDPDLLPSCEVVYLCAGTKGFRNCQGNHAVFRSDVDGNIKVAKRFLRQGTFVVFISTDAVEWSTSDYARNRMLVEMALILQPNTAIIRPTAFNERNVEDLANLCMKVGKGRLEGLHYWGKRC